MDATLYNQPVVIDNGSGNLKAGFAGEDRPKVYGSAVVGRPKYQKIMAGGALASDDVGPAETFVGDGAQQHRGLLRLSYPIDHGVVTNWDDMERLWHHTYTQDLRTNSEDHPLLVTEAPLNPRANRDRMGQVFFEQFNVPCLYVSIQAVLLLYASGRTTGVVVDSGDGVSHVVPVYEGFSLPPAVQRVDVAGRDVTAQLAHHLRRMTGVSLTSSAELEIARAIKEKTCFVSKDPARDEKLYGGAAYAHYRGAGAPTGPSDLFASYRLPDGHAVNLGVERFRAPEILFSPQLIGCESPGIHELAATAIAKTDLDLRPALFLNILLSGGNTLLPNFGDRLLSELKAHHHAAWGDAGRVKVKIYAPPERKYSTWIGGSILAGLLTFKKMWVTAQEYAEDPEILHRKCL